MANRVYLAFGLIAAALILSLGLYYGLYGEDISASAYPHKISFGERALFKLTARGPSDAEINITDGKGVLDGFVRLKEGSSESVFLWRRRKDMWWLFTSEITGGRQIPPVAVKFIYPESPERSINTRPVPVTVKSLVNLKEGAIYTAHIGGGLAGGGLAGGGDVSGGDSGNSRSVDGAIRIKIADDRSPLGIVDKNELLLTVVASFLGVTVVYIIFSIWSRREPKKIVLPPDKILLTQLDTLQGRIGSGKEGERELYYEFSSYLRRYLKAILNIPAQEPTTKDLLEIIDRAGAIESDKRPVYRELLNTCDSAKYSASISADTGRLSGQIEALRSVVRARPTVTDKSREGARS